MIRIKLNQQRRPRRAPQRAGRPQRRKPVAERFEVLVPLNPSMKLSFDSRQTRLEAVQAALGQSLARKRVERGETELQLLSYADRVTLWSLDFEPLFRVEQLLEMLRRFKVESSSGIAMPHVVKTALDLLRRAQAQASRRRQRIVLLTDGSGDGQSHRYTDLVKRAGNERVFLDVIAISADCDEALVQWLARETGGRAHFALNAPALARALERAFGLGGLAR